MPFFFDRLYEKATAWLYDHDPGHLPTPRTPCSPRLHGRSRLHGVIAGRKGRGRAEFPPGEADLVGLRSRLGSTQ
jgi:hypothetical protein